MITVNVLMLVWGLTWRKMYEQGGIEAVLHYRKQPGRPSAITPEEHAQIEQKLKDPDNGLCGYAELLSWIEAEFKRGFKYNTVLKYVRRHFQSKIKVAHKSHVKKDKEAVAALKKLQPELPKDKEAIWGLFTKNGKALTVTLLS